MVQSQSIKPLSERERKMITSLRQAKNRASEGLFVAEGLKSIELLLHHFELQWLVTSIEELPIEVPIEKWRAATPQLLKKLSSLQSRHQFLAIFKIPAPPPLPQEQSGLSLALEDIQDPGNLGAIIRLCDWLGIQHLFCSPGCVDPYNEKSVQASRGALGNVQIHQAIDLPTYLPDHFEKVIATDKSGTDYRKLSLQASEAAVLLLGNEGHGLSEPLRQVATECVTIPSAPTAVSESLNVSLSAAILLSSLI